MTEAEGVDAERGYLYLVGDMDSTMLAFVMEQLPDLVEDEELERIVVHIASSGGEAHVGIGLYDLLRRTAMVKPLVTIAIGELFSGAVTAFLAGDRRVIYPHTIVGVHGCQGGCDSSVPVRVVAAAVEGLQAVDGVTGRIMEERTGKSWAEVLGRGEFVHYSAEEAVALGIATQLAPIK